MLTIAASGIVVTLLLALTRALAGPTVFDRILAANVFATKTVLLISVLGFLSGRPAFLDLALLYAPLNFIGIIAVLKFVRYGSVDLSEASQEWG